MHRAGSLPESRTVAVRARIPAAQYDHSLALGGDGLTRNLPVSGHPPVLLRQVIHGQVDAVQLPARYGKVSGLGGPARQNQGVEVASQILHRHVESDVGPGLEEDTLFPQQIEAAPHHPLLQLEIGNSIGQQPPDAVGSFEHGDPVAHLVQLVRAGQAGRTRTHHGHLFPGPNGGRRRLDPAFTEGMLDDADFDLLDGDRFIVDSQHTGLFAGRRTDPAGKLGEVVGLVQYLDGFLPAVSIDQVVPVRNDVAQRTTGVAEGNAAIHAAGPLTLHQGVGRIPVHLKPVLEALLDGATGGHLSADFHESRHFSHGFSASEPLKGTLRPARNRSWNRWVLICLAVD